MILDLQQLLGCWVGHPTPDIQPVERNFSFRNSVFGAPQRTNKTEENVKVGRSLSSCHFITMSVLQILLVVTRDSMSPQSLHAVITLEVMMIDVHRLRLASSTWIYSVTNRLSQDTEFSTLSASSWLGPFPIFLVSGDSFFCCKIEKAIAFGRMWSTEPPISKLFCDWEGSLLLISYQQTESLKLTLEAGAQRVIKILVSR